MGAIALSTVRHLVSRFVRSLWPGGPTSASEDWVAGVLRPEELALWRRMSGVDRRHAVGVAHRVEAALGEQASTPVLAAALLHDVGKVESGLGTMGRVVATLGGRYSRLPLPARMRRYLRHAPLGGSLLGRAGSDPLTVAWAAEHHLPAERWSIPAHLATALKQADDD